MSLRILLVEDNPLNADLACAILEAEGHNVVHAADGAAFRRRLASDDPYDLVLMDVLLPDSDGVTLLGELRESRRWARVPAIAVTAQALPGDMAQFIAAGFAAVITKPIDTRTFVSTVAAHARRER